MAEIVVMPKLGLTMETGTVSAWTVAEGDPVGVGMVIAEITTEKITYELEAQAEGVLLQIILPEDEEAEVGAPIAVIGQPGEDISFLGGTAPDAGVASGVGAAQVVVEVAAAGEPVVAAPARESGGRIVASPAAKKLAAELGVDLTGVVGTGPGGRTTLEDVQTAAAAPAPALLAGAGATDAAGEAVLATPVAKRLAAEMRVDLAGVAGSGPSGRVRAEDVTRAAPAVPAGAGALDLRGGALREIPYAGMRRLVGEHMDASRAVSPMVTYFGLADVERVKQSLASINATRPDDDKINVTALIVKAVALTLEKMPRVNATLEGDVIKLWTDINVGVAVALADGLIVPVVREANRKSLAEIAREIRDLAQRARENKLLPDDVSGGTFTVSTLGSYRSVDWFTPIINQPEAAILGVGRMRDTVVAVDGQPAVCATMGLSLTCDHRLLDGAPAADFLRMLMDYLAEPVSMFI
jgi:pyruvate dehydrogenase E2 component (dihydrolipoyllysine-residue acetyltransferase)